MTFHSHAEERQVHRTYPAHHYLESHDQLLNTDDQELKRVQFKEARRRLARIVVIE